MLLYVHVPYCRARCAYCAFHSRPIGEGTHGPVLDAYCETVLREMRAWAGALKDGMCDVAAPVDSAADGPDAGVISTRVTSVFFGGGTPSLLSPENVGQVLDEADRLFGLAPDAEVSLEANPESLHDTSRTKSLRACGVNRVSLGVQSLRDRDLRVLGRIHTVDMALRAVEAVRAADLVLNLDFMWALPGQTTEDWCEVLERACDLAPDHLSAYNLTLEEGTLLARLYGEGTEESDGSRDGGKGTLPLADEEEQRRMFLTGRDLLRRRGYKHYEISNYARNGSFCRHNLGYWKGDDYLGLGPSAVSTFGAVRYAQPEDDTVWRSGVDAFAGGRTPFGAAEVERRDRAARVRECVMLSLRTSAGLSLERYRRLAGHDFESVHGSTARALVRSGLASLREGEEDGRLVLTPEGMLVANAVVERFFEEEPDGDAPSEDG